MTQAAGIDPDRELLQAIAQGDKDALSALYGRYGLKLLSYLTFQLRDSGKAEEVLQDVMLAVWNQAAHFRGESKVWTWLLTIARYRAMSALRSHKPPDLPLDESIPAQEAKVYEAIDQQSQHKMLLDAINRLPADQQEICELIFYFGLTAPEISQLLSIPVGTVKSRLHRAKTALRNTLKIQENEHE
jgi:RNA polymerase sigma-70 factor, ECF subfamily